jgi:hypothetical protein
MTKVTETIAENLEIYLDEDDQVEKTKCKAHKSYAAKRKPASGCETCWAVWFIKNEVINFKSE